MFFISDTIQFLLLPNDITLFVHSNNLATLQSFVNDQWYFTQKIELAENAFASNHIGCYNYDAVTRKSYLSRYFTSNGNEKIKRVLRFLQSVYSFKIILDFDYIYNIYASP